MDFMIKWHVFPIASLLLSACSSQPSDDTSFVQSQWTKGIQKLGLGLTPVYPPSEDYQVGDVYAVGTLCHEPEDKAERDKLPRAIRIGTANDTQAQLAATYRRRFLFPRTPIKDVSGIAAINLATPLPTQTAAKDTHGGQLTPVPIVAFPEFNIASGSLDKFGGTFATSAFGAIFGASYQKDVNLSVKIKQGETYGLDAPRADNSLNNFCKSGVCNSNYLVQLLNQSIAPKIRYNFCSAQPIYVQRVYATRSIDYQYSFASAYAFKAAASVANAAAAGAVQTAAVQQSALSKIVGADKTTDVPQPTDANSVKDQVMASLVSGLGDSLNQLASAQANGAYFLSASYSSQTVTLTQVFDRPVVFGYSGLYAGGRYVNGTFITTHYPHPQEPPVLHPVIPQPVLPPTAPPVLTPQRKIPNM
jgi:hypothetical protein